MSSSNRQSVLEQSLYKIPNDFFGDDRYYIAVGLDPIYEKTGGRLRSNPARPGYRPEPEKSLDARTIQELRDEQKKMEDQAHEGDIVAGFL